MVEPAVLADDGASNELLQPAVNHAAESARTVCVTILNLNRFIKTSLK